MTNSSGQAGRRTMAEFQALGPVEAMVAGRTVDLGAPKQRALLTLLVSQVGRPVTRDVILEALWEGNPPPSAMTSLQAYVAKLRKVLEPGRAPRTPAAVLRTCPRGYLLDAAAVDVDVRRFVAHAEAGWQARDRDDARQALHEFDAGLALWRGPAYAEVTGAPCVVPEVARLEELRLSVVEMRCAALLALGAHEVAVAELRAFIKANPLREYSCELLSLSLYRAGRQADALEVLRTIQRRLSEELGVDPTLRLQHVRQQILNQDPALNWQPAAACTAQPASVLPAPPAAAATKTPAPPLAAAEDLFVGPETAIRQLTEALAAAEARRGQVVTVSGAAGAGKTSLLRQFAERSGVPVLWGTCAEHLAAPPLALWEQVLRAADAAFPHRPAPGPVAAGGILRLFDAVVRHLSGLSRTGALVVVLDHLHRADPDSLRLLAQLAQAVPSSRLLLITSYRSGEAPALADTLAGLAAGHVTRIQLPGPTAGDDSHPAPAPVPSRAVVLRRIERLPQPAAELLAVAAVAGRHFDVEVVADVASIEIDTALAVLDSAIAAGLIEEDQQRLGWFRFTDAALAQALYETTGRMRRGRLLLRIGAAAGQAWATEQAAESVRHRLLAAKPATTR